MSGAVAKAAEENPAQDEQSYGLPVTDHSISKDRRHQPIPEYHHQNAEYDKRHDTERQQFDYPTCSESPPMKLLPIFYHVASPFSELVIYRLQAPPEVKNGVMLS